VSARYSIFSLGWKEEANANFLVAAVADLCTHDQRVLSRSDDKVRTFGMGSWPLNRRRTRLSIPFGFLHASFTLA
jgi:hypothetical protein